MGKRNIAAQFRKERRQAKKIDKIRQKKEKEAAVPLYNSGGKVVTPGVMQKRKRTKTIIAVVAFILALIYLPQVLVGTLPWEKSVETQSVHGEASYDSNAIRTCNNFLRSSPGDDFDGDGLTNVEEIEYSTNPWNVDTDGDGAYDSYEVRVSNTNPVQSDKSILVDVQTRQDKQNGGKDANSPFRVDDVVLWADDYHAKAHGTIVKTLKGYRVCGGFEGYAKFASEEGRYAYAVSNGVHTLLPYREEEGAWRVSDGQVIEFYDNLMEKTERIAFMGKAVYLNVNPLTRAIAIVLPDRGIISGKEMLKVDADPDTSEPVTADIVLPSFDMSDMYRFSINTNTLQDYSDVMHCISEQKGCVAASMFNKTNGEEIVVIYGYTMDGKLLYADPDTLQPKGYISVKEMSKKVIDENGEIKPIIYFEFNADGFSSYNGDRICFFAVSQGNNTMQGNGGANLTQEGTGGDSPQQSADESNVDVPPDTESVAASEEPASK